MVFSSYIFVFYFLPLALLVTYGLFFAPQRARNLALALLARLFLIMLGSVVLTDALDWALRTLVEITGSAGS